MPADYRSRITLIREEPGNRVRLPYGYVRGLPRRGPLTSAITRSTLAGRCAQPVRSACHQDTHAAGWAVAEKILATFTSCPIPEVARLGRTLKQWRSEFRPRKREVPPGYFDTDGASNGGIEAVNGLIELHRRIARGLRNQENYRHRMLFIAGGLGNSPHTHR